MQNVKLHKMYIARLPCGGSDFGGRDIQGALFETFEPFET